MSFAARRIARTFFGVLVAALPLAAWAQLDVTTERYDDSRLGANLLETQLTTANVNADAFGKLWSYTVSGSVYAQPLYVRNVTINGTAHNVLYVVTMNDMIYAFDADSMHDTPLLSFDVASEDPDSFVPCILDILGYNDNIIGNVGIESTPVIDPATNTIYFVSRLEQSSTGACMGDIGQGQTFTQSLHALDMTTFEEKPGSPVVIEGSVPGNGSGSSGGTLTFDPRIQDQRSSLALTNGRIFIAWSSHSDNFDYHGWVMAYDATTLQQTMIWSDSPNGSQGGIWMAGRAPTVDADGNVYYTTGNGSWDGNTNFGESFVKFGATPDSPFLDWFTPSSYQLLNNFDLDLAGSGPILVPGTDLIVSAGKSGYFYVTRTDDLGHESADDTNIVQVFENSRSHDEYDQVKGGSVYWNRDGGVGPWMYVWSDGCNHFNAYRFNGTDFDLPPISQSTVLSPCGSSGGVLTLSANGSTVGSGIVWVSMPVSGDGNSGVHHGMLRAFNADDLSTELWNSNQNQARDDAGNWPKFSPPTVVNGHVYLASFPDDGVSDTAVSVYGLLAPPGDFALSATPPNPGVNPGGEVTYTIEITETNDFADPVHLDAGALPDGVTATFAANDLTPPATTTLTLAVDASVADGQYPLAINATSGSLQHALDNGFYVTEAAPGAGVISIDLKGAPAGLSLTPTDAAGLVPKPNWTEVDGLSGTALALADESAVASGATLDWSTQDFVLTGAAGPSPNFAMMNTAFDADGGTTTLTVSNLPAIAGGYFIYVYADGANDATDQASNYTLTGNDGESMSVRMVDAANTTFDGTFVLANGSANNVGNYAVLFTGGTGFTLTVQAADGGAHAPINGVQIVAGDRIFGNGFD